MEKDIRKRFMELCHEEYVNIASISECVNGGLKRLKEGDVKQRTRLIRSNERLVKRVHEFVDNVGIILNVTRKRRDGTN